MLEGGISLYEPLQSAANNHVWCAQALTEHRATPSQAQDGAGPQMIPLPTAFCAVIFINQGTIALILFDLFCFHRIWTQGRSNDFDLLESLE